MVTGTWGEKLQQPVGYSWGVGIAGTQRGGQRVLGWESACTEEAVYRAVT